MDNFTNTTTTLLLTLDNVSFEVSIFGFTLGIISTLGIIGHSLTIGTYVSMGLKNGINMAFLFLSLWQVFTLRRVSVFIFILSFSWPCYVDYLNKVYWSMYFLVLYFKCVLCYTPLLFAFRIYYCRYIWLRMF